MKQMYFLIVCTALAAALVYAAPQEIANPPASPEQPAGGQPALPIWQGLVTQFQTAFNGIGTNINQWQTNAANLWGTTANNIGSAANNFGNAVTNVIQNIGQPGGAQASQDAVQQVVSSDAPVQVTEV